MNGFSQALIEDYGGQLQGEARMYLDQIILGSRKMGELIDGLLALSRSTRGHVPRLAGFLRRPAAGRQEQGEHKASNAETCVVTREHQASAKEPSSDTSR